MAEKNITNVTINEEKLTPVAIKTDVVEEELTPVTKDNIISSEELSPVAEPKSDITFDELTPVVSDKIEKDLQLEPTSYSGNFNSTLGTKTAEGKMVELTQTIDGLRAMIREAYNDPKANKPLVEAFKWGNKMVELGATKLEEFVTRPETPAALGIPAYMGAEMLRWYKPSYLITAMMAGPILKKTSQGIGKTLSWGWKRVPKVLAKPIETKIFKPFLKFMTINRGLPQKFVDAKNKAYLDRLRGARSATELQEMLSTDPITGKPLTESEQLYLGKLFRDEINLSGQRSRLLMKRDVLGKMEKEIEVNVAFNGKYIQLKNDLRIVNKELNSIESRLGAKVGQKHMTKTGRLEEASGVRNFERTSKTGRKLKSGRELEINTIRPREEIATGESVLGKGVKQVKGLDIINKPKAVSRKALLNRRKIIARNLSEIERDISDSIRLKYDLFDDKFVLKIRNHPKYTKLKNISDDARKLFDEWSTLFAESGIPSKEMEEVIKKNIGSYMARIYLDNVVKKSGPSRFRRIGARLGMLKKRKELSEVVMNQKGLIRKPAIPTALRTAEMSRALADQEVYKSVANNPEWISNTVKDGFVQMPKNKYYGKLSEKYVEQGIAEDLLEGYTRNQANIYDKALSAWKYGKIVLNPAAQARNIMSNTILLDLSGVNQVTQAKMMPSVIKEYLSKGKFYQEAVEQGLLEGSFFQAEASLFLEAFGKGSGDYISNLINGSSKISKIIQSPGKFFQFNEQYSKLLKYMHMRAQGATKELAAKEAEKWLFNYGKIPKFVEFIRKSPFGAPFITFSYKAMPRIGETLMNNPLKIYKYYALANSWNEAVRKQEGMTRAELKNIPDWMESPIPGMPTYLLLPGKRGEKKRYLNIGYILPVGQAPEIIDKGLVKGIVSNPLFGLVSSLTTNKDGLGRDIIPEGIEEIDKGRANSIMAEHIYQQIAPNLFPGGVGWEKVKDAIEKIPDSPYASGNDVKVTPEEAILDVIFGMKIVPVNDKEVLSIKAFQLKSIITSLRTEMRRVARGQEDYAYMTKEERNKEVSYLKKKLIDYVDREKKELTIRR